MTAVTDAVDCYNRLRVVVAAGAVEFGGLAKSRSGPLHTKSAFNSVLRFTFAKGDSPMLGKIGRSLGARLGWWHPERI